MRGRLLLAVIVVLVTLAAPLPALAGGGPVRYVFEDHFDASFPPILCDFPVRVQWDGLLASIEFTDAEGNVVKSIEPVAGRFQAYVTNLDTGRRIRVPASGPGIFSGDRDSAWTFTTYGAWLVIYNPVVNDIGLWILRGQRLRSQDAEGNVSFQFHGTYVDLCAELAK